MARYTDDYDKLMRDLGASGQHWSDYDLELARRNPEAGRSIYTQKQAFGSAQTDAQRQASNRAAEEIRQKYGGYSGGADGGGFTLSDKYAPPRQDYSSKYGGAIDKLLEELQGREPFSYNPASDPGYQAYAEQYRNLGAAARENAIGSAAAMTGGQLSSYALTAGQQAQNGYNAQLSNRIPELERAAHEMYLGELGQKRDDLSALVGLDETEYGRFRNQREDALTNYQLNYGVGRDALEDSRYEDETAYNRGNYKSEKEYNIALQKAQTLAAGGDFSGYLAMGYTAAEVGNLKSAYNKAQAGSGRGGSSGGGRRGNGTVQGDGHGLDTLFQRMAESGNPYTYLSSHRKDYGLDASALKGVMEEFGAWEEQRPGQTGDWAGIDMNSVSALGLGPLSHAQLDKLVERGEVEGYVDSRTGMVRFKKPGKGTTALPAQKIVAQRMH